MNGISGSNSSMIGMGTSHMNKTSTLGNINNMNMREFKNQNQSNNVFSTKNATKDENVPSMLRIFIRARIWFPRRSKGEPKVINLMKT